MAPKKDSCPNCGATKTHLCEPRAQRAVDIFETILVHTKGRFARSPFLLAVWQRDEIIRPLFGWCRFDPETSTWVRVYRIAWIELARKNGKSELLAGIALILLCADDEEGAEIYGCAKDRDQARKVFDVAERMVELSPVLSKRLTINRSQKRISDAKTGSFYEVIAADAAGNLGHNPHGVIFDEVLTQPNSELWNALRTAMGTRTQPLMVAATTAGNDPSSFAKEEHDLALKVQRSPKIDPSRFVYCRNTPEDADWQDEANWVHANPALGDFLSIQALRDEAREAALSPTKQNAFRQYRLNQWVRQTTRWLDMGLWDSNAGMVIESDLQGRKCYGGLDLASTADFTAWVLVFPSDTHDEILCRFFLPEAAVERRSPMRDTLDMWRKQGWLTVTEGDVVDLGAVRNQIDQDAQDFDIAEVAFDRWGSTETVQWLQDHEMTVWPQSQSITAMSAPSKELERLLGERRLRHGGNPVLRWMADNVEATRDSAENIKPDKKKSSEKIDGIVALVMAISASMRQEQEDASVYEGREMVTL